MWVMIYLITIIITELTNVLNYVCHLINKHTSNIKIYYKYISYILKRNKDKTFIGYQK